jgi:glycosyltransferase involved in cell wall biosynthesis
VSVFGRRLGERRRLAPALAALDGLTTVSQHHASLAQRLFGLPRPPDVIPNFVDLDRFTPRPPPPDRPLRIVHVSNFRPVKEPASMARISSRVLAQTRAELWLVGDGEMMPEVESILAPRIADGLVRRFGVRLDVENILPLTDLLLVSSRMESFCLVALEAMASGVPVVAPRVGGLPDLVEHGVSGLLYGRGDESEATRLVLEYAHDRDLRERLRAGALARARTLSADLVLPMYEQLYRELIGARRSEDDVAVGE